MGNRLDRLENKLGKEKYVKPEVSVVAVDDYVETSSGMLNFSTKGAVEDNNVEWE